MDKLIDFFTNFNNNVILDETSIYNTKKNNIRKSEKDKIVLEQEYNTMKQKEIKLDETIVNIKKELKEIINSMIPNKITDDNIDIILRNFDIDEVKQKIKLISDEYNKVSKETILNKLNEMNKKLDRVRLEGGNIDKLLIDLEKLKENKLILIDRLMVLTKKVIKINELYQIVLSQKISSEEIEDLNKKLIKLVDDIKGLNKIQDEYKILKNTLTDEDYLKELKRLNSIIESNSITNLITKVNEINNTIKPIVSKILKSDEYIKKVFKPDLNNSQNRVFNINMINSMMKTDDSFIDDINIHSLDRIIRLSENTKSIYHVETRTVAQNKWEEIMGMEYRSFSGYMNKYKFNFVDVNMNELLGGEIKSLEETLENMKQVTEEKKELIKKLVNLKKLVDMFVNSSDEIKIKLDDYMVVKKQLDNLKNEIEKIA